MRGVLVSLPTAISGATRLYIAFIICSLSVDYVLVVGAFFLTLSIYTLDRIEEFGDNLGYPAFFISWGWHCIHSKV
ncbi:MAG: hypothetical protein R6U44_05090 [Archaeoglobaceae archaeon]